MSVRVRWSVRRRAGPRPDRRGCLGPPNRPHKLVGGRNWQLEPKLAHRTPLWPRVGVGGVAELKFAVVLCPNIGITHSALATRDQGPPSRDLINKTGAPPPPLPGLGARRGAGQWRSWSLTVDLSQLPAGSHLGQNRRDCGHAPHYHRRRCPPAPPPPPVVPPRRRALKALAKTHVGSGVDHGVEWTRNPQ